MEAPILYNANTEPMMGISFSNPSSSIESKMGSDNSALRLVISELKTVCAKDFPIFISKS